MEIRNSNQKLQMGKKNKNATDIALEKIEKLDKKIDKLIALIKNK